jgi:hypothetical protein
LGLFKPQSRSRLEDENKKTLTLSEIEPWFSSQRPIIWMNELSKLVVIDISVEVLQELTDKNKNYYDNYE